MVQLKQLQKDLLIGSLLGDGNLQTNTGNNWRYKAIKKAFHQPYLEKKYEILQEFCQTPPSYSLVQDPRTGKFYDRYTFTTIYREEFQFYGNLFYKQENGQWVKHIPVNIATFLTPTALAFWYMDDGGLKWAGHSNAVRICTDSFTADEIEILKNALESNFQLEVSIQKKGNAKRISILETSYTKLRDLILPYLLPCMYYKFPDGNKGIYQGETVLEDLRFVPKDEL